MKTLPNDFVLRPRFQLKLEKTKESALNAFKNIDQPPFIIKILDDHVFITFNQKQIHFWSPQLQLEINEEDNGSIVFGLFGPSPTLWTFFMFLHFGVATIFIILGVWAYSSSALNRPYGLQLALMVGMVILWIVLYTLGRYGRKKGKPQMNSLYIFMRKILDI
ncbi:GTP-binding protein [Maribacter sp. ACAM166]|uniref:GTP-binding protein n=1 Tax=Maribacter sp. ACAM166 TaxID=2508996 RepID=UPI0010FD4128|nr:GTP-binding protein [Maribacter sp. ACAM166]TLP74377.1 GTP-binding protein [Maribacter sp. ACAM166]